jgi:phosphonate transport system substrate-binding protein
VNRRIALGTLAAGLSGCGRRNSPANELRIGVTPSENEADRSERYAHLLKFLEKRLNRPVTMRQGSDYAAIVEALRSRQVDLAYFGAASYARAWLVTNGGVRPLVAAVDEQGQLGYTSVLEVKADSRYTKIEDLKGKTLAFVDPNSTTGYVAPSYFLREQGIDPTTFFGKTLFSGSHENGVIGVIRGTFDAAATWRYSQSRGTPDRMAAKGMIPAGSTRPIWRSPLLPTSAWTVRQDMDDTMAREIQLAILAFPKADPQGWAAVSTAREGGYVEVTHSVYEPVIRMVEDNLKRRREAAR